MTEVYLKFLAKLRIATFHDVTINTEHSDTVLLGKYTVPDTQKDCLTLKTATISTVWNASHCSCSDAAQQYRRLNLQQLCCENLKSRNSTLTLDTQLTPQTQMFCLPVPCPVRKVADNLEVISSGRRACWSAWSNCWLSHYCSWTQVNCWGRFICDHLLLTLSWSWCCRWFGWLWDCLKEQNFISALVRPTKYIHILLFTRHLFKWKWGPYIGQQIAHWQST